MQTLASIHLYPIKSTAGMPLESRPGHRRGLAGDRRYIVVKPDGSFITARTHPQLQQVVAPPWTAACSCTIRALGPSSLQERDFPLALGSHRVWSDHFTALHTTEIADSWLSRVAGEPVCAALARRGVHAFPGEDRRG